MKHAPNMTEDTINRSTCSLQTHRPALITSSVRHSSGAEKKHHAIRPNTGKTEAEFSLTDLIQPNCQISPIPDRTYKSP